MDVPVEACAGAEGGIDVREELAGEVRGEVAADDVVEAGGEEEFVDVEGEGGEGEGVGEGCREADEQGGWREGEWVVHGSDRVGSSRRRGGPVGFLGGERGGVLLSGHGRWWVRDEDVNLKEKREA